MNKELEIIELTVETIKEKIYIICGQKAMLDLDLAEIYRYETKRFNQQVKRNIEKIPDDFMFQLNNKEWSMILKSQIVTSS